jgi:hypothetical protein
MTATPTLRSVVWTPAASTAGPYFVCEQTAATASTIWIDGVQVVQAFPAILTAATDTSQTTMTVAAIPSEWPQTPFPALIRGASNNGELVTVRSISGTTITVDRAQEGTSGVAASQYDAVYALPKLRTHFEGSGAYAPICQIGAASDGNSSTFTPGFQQTDWGLVGETAPGTAPSSEFGGAFITPSLIPSDEYAGKTTAVETWTRFILNQYGTASWTQYWQTSDMGGALPVLGNNYSLEFGSASVGVTLPTSGTIPYARVSRTGTMLLNSLQDDSRIRSQSKLTRSGGTAPIGMDTLIFLPARSRVSTVTAKDSTTVSVPLGVDDVADMTLIMSPDGSVGVSRLGYLGSWQEQKTVTSAASIGGALPELPTGPIYVFLRIGTHTPDSSNNGQGGAANGYSERWEFFGETTVRLGVTPRWHFVRT